MAKARKAAKARTRTAKKAKPKRGIYQAADARRKRPLRRPGESAKAHRERIKRARGEKTGAWLIDAATGKPFSVTPMPAAKPGHHPGQPTRKVSEIKLGARHRKDFGDLASLARSIDDRGGLLQPIVITKDNKLIAGERRLRAWPLTRFKAQPIPVHIVDIDSVVAGEWDENAKRKDFTPSEAVAIKRALEPVERAKAKARVHAGVKSDDAGRAADKVAEYLGRDRKTIAKAEEVVAAAEKNPKKFGALVEQMDKTGKVSGVHKRLQILQQTEAIKKTKPGLPMKGKVGGAVIDFPWWSDGCDVSQEEIDAAGRSFRPYPAMSYVAGKAFMRDQVAPILADDCVVAMWVTNWHMPYVFEFLKLLGFNRDAEGKPPHATILTWNKVRIARGQTLREVTEHVVIARRGKVTVNLGNETTLLTEERRENSRKPDAFYALFEKVFPCKRYADIFSRGGRGPRWDCHGDQIGKFPPAIVQAATDAVLAEAKGVRGELSGAPLVGDADDGWHRSDSLLGALVMIHDGRAAETDVDTVTFLQKHKLVTGGARPKLTAKGVVEKNKLAEEVRKDRLAALPSSIDDLCHGYKVAVAQFHEAVLAGDRDREAVALERLDLLQVKANGGDRFGMAVASSDAEALRAGAAAPLGTVPLWGQRGLFRVMVDGTPHLVSYADDHFGIHAEDPDKPFVSETGYRSMFVDGEDRRGKTVDQAVIALIDHAIRFDTSSGKDRPRKGKLPMPAHVYVMPENADGGADRKLKRLSASAARKRLMRDAVEAAAGTAPVAPVDNILAELETIDRGGDVGKAMRARLVKDGLVVLRGARKRPELTAVGAERLRELRLAAAPQASEPVQADIEDAIAAQAAPAEAQAAA
ncbi:MT-A70 family methyltransferase [Pseudorhodoplanes sp.]|uniref:MT-A70 family methyltransferase n=1 Tax=Pseudorhodoplanes sp. TaxID=1934341 RepID=UPI003D112F7D